MVILNRFIKPALGGKSDAQVIVSRGIIRIQANGFLKLADGPADLVLVEEGDAKIVVGLGEIRF